MKKYFFKKILQKNIFYQIFFRGTIGSLMCSEHFAKNRLHLSLQIQSDISQNPHAKCACARQVFFFSEISKFRLGLGLGLVLGLGLGLGLVLGLG